MGMFDVVFCQYNVPKLMSADLETKRACRDHMRGPTGASGDWGLAGASSRSALRVASLHIA